jgi:hypothetical protein
MRLTENKKIILEALSETDPETLLQWGPPPRNTATIAAMIEKDFRTVARTLRNMEKQGLVRSEARTIDVWTQLKYKQAHFPKLLKCYWNTANYEQDKAAVDEWRAGAEARSERVWKLYEERFFNTSSFA